MRKTALILMILTLLSKIIGFTRDITLSYFYGAYNVSDAYLISQTIPGTIFSLIGVGIITNYIPMYSSIEKEKSTKSADKFTNNLINFILILNSLIVIFGLLFTVPIVKIFASGFEGETLDLAVSFTKVSIFGIYFTSIVYIFSGYLQLKNNFVVPGLINIPLNFIIIFFIAISYQFDIIFLAFGTTIALVFQMLVLIPFVNKKGYKYSLTFNMYDKDLKKFVYLSIPVIIGVSVNQINVLVDRTLASQIAIGGISALTYANRLNYFVQGIFVASISTSAYPMISKLAVENNISRLKKSLSEAICGINLLIIPVTIGTMIFAKPVIKLLFGRGAFDSQAIYMTSYALFFYSIGMVGVGLREIVAKVFYSFQDTKTPMINASISLGVNVVLNIILSKFLGIGGLALASSISAIFCTVLLFISLRKKIGPFGMKNITISFIKILCASLAMGVISKVSYNALFKNINANLSLILSIGIGAITYFTIIYFMRIEEVDVIVNAIKRKMIKTVS